MGEPPRRLPDGPVFLLGLPASGVDLLASALDSDGQLAMAQQTALARLLLAHEFVPFAPRGGEWHEQLGLTDDEVEAELRDLYGRLFERFAERQGKSRWGEATSSHLWHMHRLGRVFPDAAFIGIIRHPVPVVASLREHDRHSWRSAASLWARSTVQMIHGGAALNDRFVLYRYEDLLGDHESLLRDLFDRLGRPWPKQDLVFQPPGDQPTSPLPAKAAGVIREQVGRLAPAFGYDVDDPESVRPLAAVGIPSVPTGNDLSSLLPNAEAALGWTGPPMPPPEDSPLDPNEFRRPRRRAAAKPGGKASPGQRGPSPRPARRLPPLEAPVGSIWAERRLARRVRRGARPLRRAVRVMRRAQTRSRPNTLDRR